VNFSLTTSKSNNHWNKEAFSDAKKDSFNIHRSLDILKFNPPKFIVSKNSNSPKLTKDTNRIPSSLISPPTYYSSGFKEPIFDPYSQWMIPEYSPNKAFRNYVNMKELYLDYQWSDNSKDISSCPFEIEFIREGLRYNVHKLWNRPISESIIKESHNLYHHLKEKSLEICKKNQTEKIIKVNPNKIRLINDKIKYYSNTLNESKSIPNQSSKNWDSAVLMVDSWSLSPTKNYISPKDICDLHTDLVKDIPSLRNPAGQYRYLQAFSGKSHQGFYFLSHHNITQEVNYFCDWLNKGLFENYQNQGSKPTSQNPITLASKAYERFVSIHPFIDGNGRVGRSVLNFVLQKFNLLPPCLDKKDPRSAGGVSGMIPYKIPSQDDVILAVMNGLKTSYSFFE
jgi:fido (protein-threonine AMPylation protein)